MAILLAAILLPASGCFADAPLLHDGGAGDGGSDDGGSGSDDAEDGGGGDDNGAGSGSSGVDDSGAGSDSGGGDDSGAGSDSSDAGDSGSGGMEVGECEPGTPGCACVEGACDAGVCLASTGTCVVTDGAMVTVPAGSFLMGCSPADDACEADELPPHEVTLPGFAIDEREVDVASYLECVDAGVCAVPGMGYCTAAQGDPELPINCISQSSAATYCEWIGKRLPTEAEWEKAAHGSDGRIYPWGDEEPSCALAIFDGCGGIAHPGSRPEGASPYGALDMAGNLAEWTSDAYAADYYGHSPSDSPQGPEPTGDASYRGGSASVQPELLRVTKRWSLATGSTGGGIGIRCAVDLSG